MKEIKFKDDLHHPVTNGSTKKMVWLSIIFIFVLTLTSLVFAFIGSFHLTGISLYLMKGSFASFALTGMLALVGVTRKFFDTRSTEMKAADKLAQSQENHKYKLEKLDRKYKRKK